VKCLTQDGMHGLPAQHQLAPALTLALAMFQFGLMRIQALARTEECALPASLPECLVAEFESHQREDMFPSYEDSPVIPRVGGGRRTESALPPETPEQLGDRVRAALLRRRHIEDLPQTVLLNSP
jgi:hypothetical protein